MHLNFVEDLINRQANLTGTAPLRACALSKSYGQRVALRQLSVDFHPGVTALLGKNGAGKSTLIRTLTSVQAPDSGQVEYFGKRCAGGKELRAIRANLGWLPQQFSFPGNRTLKHYLEYVGWLKNMPKGQRRAAATQVAATVGLSDRLNDQLGGLSGGMIRRAGLAQAIINSPQILILDEPTAGLDPEQRAQFAELIRALGASSTVVLATHLLEDVSLAADRVAVMDGGVLTFTGTLLEFSGGEPKPSLELLNSRFRELGASS